MTFLKIACLGEAMIEMVIDKEGKNAALGVAGDSMNTAVYLARCLGADCDVAFVSMIGPDPLSDRIEKFIAEEGIKTNLLKRHSSKLPGLYAIKTNEAGERSFSYWRNMSAAREVFSSSDGIKFEDLNGFNIIFMSAISLAILPPHIREQFFNWLDQFRSAGGRFVFDSNYRPALWTDTQEAQIAISSAWKKCDIALPSIDDEMALFRDKSETEVLQRLKGYGITTGVLKRGELGPIPIGNHGTAVISFAPATKIIDTTAAGDSFNGGFLASYLTNGDLAQAMKAGHDLANIVIAYRGAIVPRAN